MFGMALVFPNKPVVYSGIGQCDLLFSAFASSAHFSIFFNFSTTLDCRRLGTYYNARYKILRFVLFSYPIASLQILFSSAHKCCCWFCCFPIVKKIYMYILSLWNSNKELGISYTSSHLQGNIKSNYLLSFSVSPFYGG